MTNEQAILHLNAVKSTTDSGQMHRAIEMAIEALKKQIPKDVGDDGIDYICPRCGADIYMYHQSTSEEVNYCCMCGQAIDWEVEE